MSLNSVKFAALTILLSYSSVAFTLPFKSLDTRSMAMGGAGVAVGGAEVAPLFNPALLSVTKESEKFSIILPTVGIRVADPDNLRDKLDSFQNGNYVNNLQSAINTLNGYVLANNTAAIPTAALAVNSNLLSVSTQLATLNNKPINLEGGVATVVAVPSKTMGIAFYINAAVAAGGSFSYNDKSILDTLAAQALTCSGNATAPECASLATFDTNNLSSGIRVKGVTIGEIGFSLSREFELSNHKIAFGVTPKITKATLFDSVILANDSNPNNVMGSDNIAEYSYVNFDLGAAKNHENGWRTGFVVKNIIPQTLNFKSKQVPTGDSLKLMPQARFGVSHENSWSTVALDVDLTRNDPAGLENPSQFVAMGTEMNAFDWAQLRFGYRVDLVNSGRNIASMGFGFSPFGAHADLAFAGNANEVGASLQLGFRY